MATKAKAAQESAPKSKKIAPAVVSAPEKKSAAKPKAAPAAFKKPAPVQTAKEAKPASKTQSRPTAVVEEPKKKSSVKAVEKPAAKSAPKPAPKPAVKPVAKESVVQAQAASVATAADSDQKWQEIRVILEKLKEDTLREIRKSVKNGTEAVAAIEPGGDIYDQASSERDRELGLLLGDREREKIHSIDEALLRIDEGDYGICEECDEDIPLGRLKAMPFTRHCVKCKSDLEKLQAQTKRVEEERAYREIPLGAEDEEA